MLAACVLASSGAVPTGTQPVGLLSVHDWGEQTLRPADDALNQQQQEEGSYADSVCNEWCGMPERSTPMKCGVFWFLHVPKTGGTTLMKYFKEHAGDRGWLYADMWKMKIEDDELGSGPIHWAKWNQTEEWAKVNKALEKDSPKVLVHAHHNMPGLGNRDFVTGTLTPLAEKLASKGCELRFGAVLRDAVEHVKSAAFFGAVRDSEDMARYGPRNTNPMTKYVVYNYQSQWPIGFKHHPSPKGADEKLIKSAQSILANFSLVGRTEDLDGFVKQVNLALGWPEDNRAERENITPSDRHYKLSTEEVATLQDLNVLDNKLYQQFCEDSPNSVCAHRRSKPPGQTPSFEASLIDLGLPFRSHHKPAQQQADQDA